MADEMRRATGLLVIEVVNSNPNGDPDREADPRQRPNGLGEISPVSFKRKVRDLLDDSASPFFESLPDKFKLNKDHYRILEHRGRDRNAITKEMTSGGKLADFCIITEDNSRYEDVQEILTDIKVGLSMTSGTYIEIPDRRKAIEFAVSHAREGDMIAIIGKGHEDYQEIKGVRYPFLDRQVVQETVEKLGL